jgi:hypothetical protein
VGIAFYQIISMLNKVCSSCSNNFQCGSIEGTCWCMSHVALTAIVEGKDCLCEACLTAAIKVHSKDGKESEESDYYIENGFYVFTRSYHLKRGTCCGNACRHCPYEK